MASVGDFSAESDYDRMKEVKAFDDTNAGVKGLVDAGIINIPKIFIRPTEDLVMEIKSSQVSIQLPVIDLSNIQEGNQRKKIIDEVRVASEKWGFFLVVNHGIPLSVLDDMIDGIRRFHEQDLEEKKKYYTRDNMRTVKFDSNYDLYKSKFATWRDTLTVHMPANNQVLEALPATCSESTLEFAKHIHKLGETLLELLSEALGLKSDHLKSIGCKDVCSLVCHYYPACPQPELTLGANKHVDGGVLTLLLQSQIRALQVLHEGQWVDVDPVPGAFVANIGHLLQILSNDKFRGVEHRVLANHVGPRISVASFFSGPIFNPSQTYGPIRELTSADNPPRYKEIVLGDYLFRFFTTALGETCNLDYYRI